MGGTSAFNSFIASVATLVLAGILVVLVMLLVEIKRFTDENEGLYISMASGESIPVEGRQSYPLYMKALP